MAKEVQLKVDMMCGGCEAAVRRVLTKLEGVQDVAIDLASNKVVVRGDVQPQEVFDKVAKTGKKTEWWQ